MEIDEARCGIAPLLVENKRNKSYDGGWSYLLVNDRSHRTILCKDPRKPTDARVEEMINSY